MLKSLKKLPAILVMALMLMNATAPVQAFTTTSDTAADYNNVLQQESWTWTDFGANVFGGAVGGAAAGAVAGSAAGGICAGPGALTGGLAGAVGGGAYYAGTQAWNAVFGAYVSDDGMFSETALN